MTVAPRCPRPDRTLLMPALDAWLEGGALDDTILMVEVGPDGSPIRNRHLHLDRPIPRAPATRPHHLSNTITTTSATTPTT